MVKTFFCILLSFLSLHLFAGKISGLVADIKGHPLSFATILVKGTTIGTTANNEGRFVIDLDPGKYTISAGYVGYQRQEKSVEIGNGDLQLNFQLSLLNLSLKEVTVKAGAEDPAYEIIRQAIKKRAYFQNQIKSFQCQVYTKGIFRLTDYPKRVFGQKVDFPDGDTSKKKILYLSETVAKYSVDEQRKSKIEVLSTRVSGSSNGYGFSAPQIISFYENNIQFGSNLNQRGFVSPIADNALNFYKYKYLGSFFEDGKEINKILVIPKRKYEPLFSGFINIVENDWRIHSLQLLLTKESQMEFLDSLKIEQIFVPLEKDIWVIKTQVFYPHIKLLGFEANGNFVTVYSKFDVTPEFDKKYFDATILKYDEGSNKKPGDYWDKVRPLPLQTEEINDYRKKDSLEIVRRNPRYLDSMDKVSNKVSVNSILLTGQTFDKRKAHSTLRVEPLLRSLQFNTVEGVAMEISPTWNKRLDTIPISRHVIIVSPVIRYGFSNNHLNSSITIDYSYDKIHRSNIIIKGGKDIFQFNNQNPIEPFVNSVASLYFRRNYLKIYEAWIGRVSYFKELSNGLTLNAGLEYQDRIPLENTTNYSIRSSKRDYSPNYPAELMSKNFERHHAFILGIGASWKPGSMYIELPEAKFSIGSKYPTFNLNIYKGLPGLFGSAVDYTKWRFTISNNINMKLLGSFRCNLSFGGFLQKDSVAVPDMIHFNGNQVFLAANYLNSFQLLPYYKFSNTANIYSEVHLEHHLNGLLTNKIPLFRKLNWHLVTGANAFYINDSKNYIEIFAGLENILRIMRLDAVWGFENGKAPLSGLRLGISILNNNRN